MKKNSVAIIGAGICGLSLGAHLNEAGIDHFIIEKSRGVGGRLATRRDGAATYDHGAAFYVDTVAEPCLWHLRWQARGKAQVWFTEDMRRYACGLSGMTGLAKDLAQDQTLLLEEKTIRFQTSQNEVQIFCESEKVLSAEKIILTCPLPQSLDILRASGVSYPQELNLIHYERALVGLFELHDRADLFKFDLLRPDDSSIFTIANNQAKGISTSLALTVVMSTSWSEFHFNDNELDVLKLIETELARVLKFDIQLKKSQLKKWRYSQPASVYKDRCVSLGDGQIILAGDAFGGGSIAGALRSAAVAFSVLTGSTLRNERLYGG